MSTLACRARAAFSCARTNDFTQTAEVLRATPVRDRFGSVSSTKVVAHTYPCRVTRAAAKPTDVTQGADLQVKSDWTITLPLTADVKAEDEIRVDGQIFSVDDTDRGRADASFLTVWARKTR